MEAAARRRIHCARNVAFQQRALAHDRGIRLRHGRQQRTCVGVARIAEELFGRRSFNDLAEVHHGDAVGDMLHDREIVADEHIGQAKARLKRPHQIDDLRLDRDVERRNRLVGHDQLRLDGERAGNR